MAKTYKRQPLIFNFDTKNFSEHFNQMDFKGIIHQNNIFEVDQLSLKEAKNVYRDEDKILVSRDPLVLESLPATYKWINGVLISSPILSSDYSLVDIFEVRSILIYISRKDTYRIVAKKADSNIIMEIPHSISKYHITTIGNYVIAFNNVEAMVLETNNFNNGWRSIQDFVEIPVTKRIVGQDIFVHPENKFTKSYKEEYQWSLDIINMLPSGDAVVEVNQPPDKLIWTLEDANINTEARVLRSLRQKVYRTDIISIANTEDGVPIICIAKSDYVLISLNGGLVFDKILYPNHLGFLNIASISKDGSSFYFVAVDGVYRYTIGRFDEEAWRKFSLSSSPTLKGTGYNNICHFHDASSFSFITFDTEDQLEVVRIFAKSPILLMTDGGETDQTAFDVDTLGYYTFKGYTNRIDQLNLTRTDCSQYSLCMDLSNGVPVIVAWLVGSHTYSNIISIVGSSEPLESAVRLVTRVDMPYGMLYEVKSGPTHINDIRFRGVQIVGLTIHDNYWYHFEGTVGAKLRSGEVDIYDDWYKEYKWYQNTSIELSTNGAPFKLGNIYLADKTTYSIDGVATLPTEILGLERIFTVSLGAYYYILLGNTLYSNQMTSEHNAILIYTYIDSTPFSDVPDISHVNNELYLAFDNVLRITDNAKTSLEVKLNLPIINDQIFTSSVNGIITISTSEVAIFLLDKIYLVTQQPDEIFGYRYDYQNTRLSVGVRQGDGIINSRDGIYTFYPTDQGLAVMNYQQDVATTDQMVNYVTDNIINEWNKFYADSTKISLTQLKDYIYVNNGTNTYWMLDLRNMSWWKFEVPMTINKIIVSNSELKLVSDKLYRFNKASRVYEDFGTKFIDWKLQSQILHFKLPNHYKNMKQIIFHLEESTNLAQTILSQIKIYRKQITYKEPEVINFKIDGYRTHVQRFNYWKINELQWALAADPDTKTPAQLRLNGLTIKYEPAEEVRN